MTLSIQTELIGADNCNMKLNKHILKRQLELDDYSTAWIVLHYVIFYLAFFVGSMIEFIQHCVRLLDRYLGRGQPK